MQVNITIKGKYSDSTEKRGAGNMKAENRGLETEQRPPATCEGFTKPSQVDVPKRVSRHLGSKIMNRRASRARSTAKHNQKIQ